MKMNVPLSELTGGGSERAREPAFYRRPGTDERETRGLECMTYNPVRNEMEVLPRTRQGIVAESTFSNMWSFYEIDGRTFGDWPELSSYPAE